MIILATSNILYKSEEDNTLLLTVSSSSNQYDIDWENAPEGFEIQARISGTLQNTIFPIEETLYRQSNGVYRRSKTYIEKKVKLNTDWESVDFHEQLIVMLKHDTFKVDGTEYFHEGEYEQEYSDFDEDSRATALLITQGFNKTNQQCS